jgi:hypothetical protein
MRNKVVVISSDQIIKNLINAIRLILKVMRPHRK